MKEWKTLSGILLLKSTGNPYSFNHLDMMKRDKAEFRNEGGTITESLKFKIWRRKRDWRFPAMLGELRLTFFGEFKLSEFEISSHQTADSVLYSFLVSFLLFLI